MYLAFSVRVQNVVPKPRTWQWPEKCLLGIVVAMYALVLGVSIDTNKEGINSVFYNQKYVVRTLIEDYNEDKAYLQADTIVFPYKLEDVSKSDFDNNSSISAQIVGKQFALQSLLSLALQSHNASDFDYLFKHNYFVSYRCYDENDNLLYVVAISPEEYFDALAQGADYRCSESALQEAENIINASLPTTYIWDDAVLTQVSHTNDKLHYHIYLTDLTYAGMCDIGFETLQGAVRDNFLDMVDNMMKLALMNKMDIVFAFSGYDSELSMEVVITPQDAKELGWE